MKKDKLRTQLEDSASKWLHKGKILGSELYEDGMKTLHDMEKKVEKRSEDLLHGIQKYPIASMLLAGGAGALLYILLKNKK